MMRAMEDAEFFLKKLRKRFMKKVPGWKRCTAVGDYNTGLGGELSFLLQGIEDNGDGTSCHGRSRQQRVDPAHHRQRNGKGVVTKGEAEVLRNGETEIAARGPTEKTFLSIALRQ